MKYRFLIIAVFLIISCQNVFSQNDFAIGFNIIPAITYSFSPSYLPSPKDNFGYSFGMNGVYFIEMLEKAVSESPLAVKEIRGIGLMIGIELKPLSTGNSLQKMHE